MQCSISSFFKNRDTTQKSGAAAAKRPRTKGKAGSSPKRRRRGVVADDVEKEEAGSRPTGMGVEEDVGTNGGTGAAEPVAGGSGSAAAPAPGEAAEAPPAAATAVGEGEEEAKGAAPVRAHAAVTASAVGSEHEECKDAPRDGSGAASSDDEDEEEGEGEEEEGKAKDARLALMQAQAKSKYNPVDDAGWTQGKPVPYRALVRVFQRIEATTKRLEIQQLACDLLRSAVALTPTDLLPLVYLACNKLAPQFEGVELGIGDSLLVKAIAEATGKKLASVRELYTEHGDLGTVADLSRATQRTLFPPPPLTVQGVYQEFRKIASIAGSKSQDRKVGLIKKLLVASSEGEARFIIRGLQGKLRIGLAESTVLVALAHAVVITPPGPLPLSVLDTRPKLGAARAAAALEAATTTLKQVYSELPSLDVLIPALLQHGVETLREHCHLTPGVPVRPMLAKPTTGVTEVLNRFEGVPFTCEYKYDGERAQIHVMADGTIRVFSRNLEDNTTKYPDVIAELRQAIAPTVKSCIMDAEVVAYDREKGCLLPFQVLSTRSRKDVTAENVKVRVIVIAFDLIYLNGETPLSERRKRLAEAVVQVPHLLRLAESMESSDTEEIATFLTESVRSGCEGLMVKTLDRDATYEPSRRSLNWLKLKKDYMEGTTDSLDLVVIGGYHGRGKRTGVFGAYLLACYNDEDETLESVCKIGTGFSDEALQQHTAFFKDKVIEKPPPTYVTGLEPDVWLDACQVWEVRAADLSLSSVHRGGVGKVDDVRGIGLRFPRFLRVREDKDVEDATSAEQVVDMYRSQSLVN